MDYIFIPGFMLLSDTLNQLDETLEVLSEKNSIIIGGLTAILDENIRKKSLEFIKYFDFLFMNSQEATFFSKYNSIKKQSDFFREHGVQNIIITRGDEGVYVSAKNIDDIEKEAYQTNVKDTTGAGDAFLSGFMYGIIKNKSILESTDLGLLTAKKCIEVISSSKGIKILE